MCPAFVALPLIKRRSRKQKTHADVKKEMGLQQTGFHPFSVQRFKVLNPAS
jgi:hypothetical protein